MEADGDFIEVWQCGGSYEGEPCQSTSFYLTREGFVFCDVCAARQKIRWRFKDPDGDKK